MLRVCVVSMCAFGLAGILAGCTHGPITSPDTGTQCGAAMKLYQPISPDPEMRAFATMEATPIRDLIERKVEQRGDIVITVLAMSGGGKYGAFGAGFLQGWSAAEANPLIADKLFARRGDVDIVTGISTGAVLASAATVGNASLADRGRIDADMIQRYRDATDDTVFRKLGLVQTVMSNAGTDTRGRLDTKMADLAAYYRPLVAQLPRDRLIFVGATNLTNGHFYVADLNQIAKDAPTDCFREWIYASSAVPAQFAPRFIDGHAWVDGGTRFGAFFNDAFIDEVTYAKRNLPPGRRITIRLIGLFNEPLSANDPSKDAEAATQCDRAPLHQAAEACKAFAADNKTLSIVERSAGDIMQNQLYLDSVFRLQRDLESLNRGTNNSIQVQTRYIFLTPARLRWRNCKPKDPTLVYDATFMECLVKLGNVIGSDPKRWSDFGDTPHIEDM